MAARAVGRREAGPAGEGRWGPVDLRSFRRELAGGSSTPVHVATFAAASTSVRVVRLRTPQRLAVWCAVRGVEHALVGGFFTRPGGVPLGELRTAGIARPHVPFDTPWGAQRACVHVAGDRVRIARRPELEREPAGDLLQAGPLLVRDGRAVVADRDDPEGFSAGARQFDSDITAGRYPRAALGVGAERLFAVACDGRSAADAGLTLAELAELLVELGAEHALNLDGGGSTSLVCDRRLRNRPRADHEVELPLGRPVATALVFVPR
jgi:hypothetical protein